MSAFLVSRQHIDIVVGGMILHRIVAFDDASAVGRELWRENLRSVSYRYPDDGDGDRPGPSGFRDAEVDTYTYTPPGEPHDLTITGAARSLRYQSCEHPEYETSRANSLIESLIAAADPRDIFGSRRKSDEQDALIQAGWAA